MRKKLFIKLKYFYFFIFVFLIHYLLFAQEENKNINSNVEIKSFEIKTSSATFKEKLSQIQNEHLCSIALGHEKLFYTYCFKNEIIDKNLPTQLSGCSVQLIDNNSNKKIGFRFLEELDKENIIITSHSCVNSGFNELLRFPVDETRDLTEFIRNSIQGNIIPDLFSSENMNDYLDLINLIEEIKLKQSIDGNRLPPRPTRAPMPNPNSNSELSSVSYVDVYYGTNRKINEDAKRLGEFYGELRTQATKTQFGKLTISIPKVHQYGKLEIPVFSSSIVTPDQARYLVIKSASLFNEDKFYYEVNQKIKIISKKEVLIFIHGFNTSFEEASLRTAQMAFDMKFSGIAMFYSWPAETILRYSVAEMNNAWSMPYIKKFIKDVVLQTGAEKIHIIAHSMGNRVLTESLNELSNSNEIMNKKIQNVILAAPDVSQIDFKKIENSIKKISNNITLYASRDDKALKISSRIHHNLRLGDSGNKIYLSPLVETIDATSVDTSFLGHAYYGNNDSVVFDIENLIMKGLTANQRPQLKKVIQPGISNSQPFWLVEN